MVLGLLIITFGFEIRGQLMEVIMKKKLLLSVILLGFGVFNLTNDVFAQNNWDKNTILSKSNQIEYDSQFLQFESVSSKGKILSLSEEINSNVELRDLNVTEPSQVIFAIHAGTSFNKNNQYLLYNSENYIASGWMSPKLIVMGAEDNLVKVQGKNQIDFKQRWEFIPVKDNIIRIVNSESKECITAIPGSDEIILEPLDNDNSRQEFYLNSNPVMPVVPLRPQNVSGSNVTTSTIDVSWSANKNDISFYEMYLNNSSGSGGEKIATLPSNQTSYHVSDLIPGTLNDIELIAVDSIGRKSKPSSQLLFFTQPESPSDLSVKQLSNTKIELSWNLDTYMKNTLVYGYEIYQDNQLIKTIYDTNSNVCEIENLESNTEYSFTIKTLAGMQNYEDLRESSDYSEAVKFTLVNK